MNKGIPLVITAIVLSLLGPRSHAQGGPNHCDSMVRAAMQGYQIPKDAPCIDVNEGDWPKTAKYYSKFKYYCVGRERNPGCS
jgi:hypothetical protein